MIITDETIRTALAMLDQQKDKDTGLYSGMLVMMEQLIGTDILYDAGERCHYIQILK